MLIARRHTAVAESHASRPCPPSIARSVAGCPRRAHRAISASSCGSGVGSGSSTRDRVVPVLGLEVLLGLRAGGAVVRVHTRECTVNDCKRYEQKITSFGTLNRQCSRWRSIASVIDRYRTPATTSAATALSGLSHVHPCGPSTRLGPRLAFSEVRSRLVLGARFAESGLRGFLRVVARGGESWPSALKERLGRSDRWELPAWGRPRRRLLWPRR